MNKINYCVSKIEAKSITHPKSNADEIYMAAFATTAKTSTENGKIALVKKFVDKKLSDIKSKVWPDTEWIPTNLSGSVDYGDAEFVYLTLALYEADDKAIYDKLKTKVEEPPQPEDFEWSSLSIPSDPASPVEWLRAIWKAVYAAYEFLKQDDNFYLYVEGIRVVDVMPGGKWTKKIGFLRYGGEYEITLELERPK